MFEIQGKYTKAQVFTDNMEQEAIGQVLQLCNQDFLTGCKVAIMPDVHAGKGCVVGFTADLGDKVIPNIVGVDIGCGMLVVKLGKIKPDLEELDRVIHRYIPAGFEVREEPYFKWWWPFENMLCYEQLEKRDRLLRGIGSLGGGNHFIELAIDPDGEYFLVIHTGSRNLGKQVAEFYQKLAINECTVRFDFKKEQKKLIEKFQKEKKSHLIQAEINKLKREYDILQPKYDDNLCFLTGDFRYRYLNDMQICQVYAEENRKVIAEIILRQFGASFYNFESFTTIHNYISKKDNIIRKGAVSAYEGEELIIPMNMRDGSIIAIGKGNPDWNFSAPHGAGRLMSRSKAKQQLNLNDFIHEMKDIYSSTVTDNTLDEAPMAYKPMQEIIGNIKDTVEIVKIITPVYNFKSA